VFATTPEALATECNAVRLMTDIPIARIRLTPPRRSVTGDGTDGNTRRRHWHPRDTACRLFRSSSLRHRCKRRTICLEHGHCLAAGAERRRGRSW